MAIPRKSYLVTLNKKPIVIVFSTGYHTAYIMQEMMEDHFEELFGVVVSKNAESLVTQYEKEYQWDFIEVDSITSQDAEARSSAIMNKKTEGV